MPSVRGVVGIRSRRCTPGGVKTALASMNQHGSFWMNH
jgi:hypothetical protein